MRPFTINILFEDYKKYQKYYKEELDWAMEETFEEYVQRCIDNGELEEAL